MAAPTLTSSMLRGGARALANPFVQGFMAAALTKGIGSGMRVYAEWQRHAPSNEVARTAKRESLLTLQSAIYSSLLNDVFQRKLWPRILRASPKMARYHELAYASLIGASILMAEVISRVVAPPKDYRDEEREIIAKLRNRIQAGKIPLAPAPREHFERLESGSGYPQAESPLMFADRFSRRRMFEASSPVFAPQSTPGNTGPGLPSPHHVPGRAHFRYDRRSID
jgi:hypothetical protein